MLVQMNAATRMLFAAVVVLMLCCLSSMAAAEETGHTGSEEFIHHRLGLFPGYTYIPGGAETAEQDQGVWVFTLGIDYVYRFQEKWSVGVAADIEFGEYLVVDKELNRENAMVLCGLAIYEVLPRWAIYAGPG
ncbi:MAG: hypothetical protein KAT30_05980, partial [Candidatus Krumholzibacteria bacterium]|nr:hypothetical protein [Candidatus Krumholzibacteria bacterium]